MDNGPETSRESLRTPHRAADTAQTPAHQTARERNKTMPFEFMGVEAYIRDSFYNSDPSDINILLTEEPTIINLSYPPYLKEEVVKRFYVCAKGFNERGDKVEVPGGNASMMAYTTKTIWFKDYDYFYGPALYRYNPEVKRFTPIVKTASTKVNLAPYVFSKKLGIWGKVLTSDTSGFTWGGIYKNKAHTFSFSGLKDWADSFHIFSPYPLKVFNQSMAQPVCSL